MRLGIVGGGRAAWAFGSTWKNGGGEISGVFLRESSVSQIANALSTNALRLDELAQRSEIILVAVRDDDLAEVSRNVAAAALPTTALFHVSGSKTSAVFEHPRGFSLHPLMALPVFGDAIDFTDRLMVYEGPEETLEIAQLIARRAGARLDRIDAGRKLLYHSAAVLGANCVAALVDASNRLMHEAGLTDRSIRDDVAALALSAIANWVAHDDVTRFTGPASRGDSATISDHLRELERFPEISAVYESIARFLAVTLARDAPHNERYRQLLERFQGRPIP